MAPPAAPRPEPDPPGAEPEKPPRPFRHLRPVDEEERGDVTRHGHGSGCIPILVFRLSILALLIYLAFLAAGLFLSRRMSGTAPAGPPTHAETAGGASPRPSHGAILEEGVRRIPAAPPSAGAPSPRAGRGDAGRSRQPPSSS